MWYENDDSGSCWKATLYRVIVPYTKLLFRLVGSWVWRDTCNLVRSQPDHRLSLNTNQSPIAYSTARERWKEPRDGSEIESETICLQRVRAHSCVITCVLKYEPESYCMHASLSGRHGGVGKPNLNRVFSM